MHGQRLLDESFSPYFRRLIIVFPSSSSSIGAIAGIIIIIVNLYLLRLSVVHRETGLRPSLP